MPVDLVLDDREGELPSKSEVESARNSVDQVTIRLVSFIAQSVCALLFSCIICAKVEFFLGAV